MIVVDALVDRVIIAGCRSLFALLAHLLLADGFTDLL
jgi:hypothetical protein